MVLRLAPGHLGALKGMGFVCFQQGRLAQAGEYLSAAAAQGDGDEQVASALEHVREARREMSELPRDPSRLPAGTSHDPRFLFADVLSDAEQTALLLDRDGLVLAGAYVAWDGRDVGQEVGAELSGVTEAAVVAMTPSTNDGLLVLATSRATPLGLVRRLLDRCAERARRWQGGRL